MSMGICARDTLLMPSVTQQDLYQKHLHIVMCEPTAQGDVLVVNISSYKENKFYDDACILDSGDHSRIKHRSFVYYRRAQTAMARDLIDRVNNGWYRLYEPMHEEVFANVLRGFYRSKFTRKFVFEYLEPRP